MGIGSRRGRVLRNITMCIMVVLIGLTSYKGNNISLAETIYSMNVRGEIVTSEDAIKLTWDAPNKSEPYTYKVYSKKPQTDSFQTISSTDLTQKVKVLNVTPEGGTPITYTTWDGTTRTVTKSASAEKWMEEPNTYHQKGFGMGLIDVEPLGMKYFNTNPEGYLKNSKGEYKYDVIFFGSWDTNNSQDLTKESQELVGEFIDTGRGVLFGHDTVDGIGNKNYNFAPLRKYVNIKLEYLDNIGYIPRTGSSKVMLEKEGLLNNYPWSIGKIGDVLDIPVAHSGGQLSFGDTWLTFKDNKLYGGSWGTAPVLEVEDPELGKGTNNFYLSTWNNTAMIQTGHSNGEATIDEQKILANTLFYLSQLTTDTKLTDRSAMDATPPKFKSTEHTIKRVNGNPKDYTEENSVTLELSALDGQSGVKSIKLPDGKIELSNRASFTVNANGDYMFEITDNVGNTTTHTETVDKIKIPYTFYIYDSIGKPLKGAGFDLLRNGIKVADSESGEDGLVNFGKVPADGKYTIKQTKAPDGYVVNPDEKDVEVGDTTEPEEFISYPRGDLLPATGKYDRLIQGLIFLGLTGIISVVSVKKIKNKRI